MLLNEADELLLDAFDPPPPYEEEEYDVYLFWPSRSPPQLTPAPYDAVLDAYAIRGCPVAAPPREVVDFRPHHLSTNSNDAPSTNSRLNTRPPYFRLSFPLPPTPTAVELDTLPLPSCDVEGSFVEETDSFTDDSSQELADEGYSRFFCSGLALKSRHFTGPLDTLYQKVQHAFKKFMMRPRRGV